MAKYNFELKKKIVLEHLSLGVGSKALAKKYNVKSARQIRQWIHNYNEFGEEGLKRSRQKNNYSFEFKLHMVESYLSNEVSYEELALANGITNYTMISRWVEAFRVAGPDGLRPRKKGRKKTLDSPKTAMLAVILVNVWQLAPWVTIICAAGLKALPQDCLEAACVDGASNGVIFRKIILPMVAPLLTIVVMLRFVDAFKVFDTVYVMTNGGPGTSTEMLPNYIYKQGLRFFDAGYSAALAIGFVVVMTVVTVGFLKLRTKLEA